MSFGTRREILPPGVIQTTLSASSLVGLIWNIGLPYHGKTKPLPNLNLCTGNFSIEFRFGEHLEFNASLNFLLNCGGDIPAVSQLPIFSSSGVSRGDCAPALHPTLLFHSGTIWPGQESTTAMHLTSNLGGNSGLACAGDSEDDTTDCAPPSWTTLSCPIELPDVLFTA